MGATCRARSRPFLNLGFHLILFGIFIPAVCTQWSGNLAAYELESFDNPIKPAVTVVTRLDHFAVHPDTEDVYVGAVNYLYRLDKYLVQAANVSTATCFGEDCLNYNKVLALAGGRLVTCGSEDQGTCWSRREGDLHVHVSQDNNRGRIVADGTKTTAGIVAPGPNGGERLYLAVSYSTEPVYQDIPPITRRLLVTGPGFLFAEDNVDDISFSSAYTNSPSFIINYVSVFVWNGFTYFATNQGQTSKLARVCHTSVRIDSYTEILIECRGPGNNLFRLLQAAHVGPAGPHLSESLTLGDADQVLYAVFADGGNSALCVYKMSDIEAAFNAAVSECLTAGSAYQIGHLQGSFCPGVFTGTTDLYVCDAERRYNYATGIQPVVGTSVIALPGHLSSSIITSIELNHTVAFIGTSAGQLLKVHVESGSTARLYEEVALDGNPVMGDTVISETAEELFVLTEQKLIKMRVENCGQYTTCETCIGIDAGNDGDPYCGWCTLERKCTRYDACPLQSVSTRWLPYNDVQCIEITEVDPHNSLPITLTDQTVTVTVQQLPDLLDGKQYTCRFGDQFSDGAITMGDTLQCMTPPADKMPEIMNGDDHVTVVLNILSSETGVDFVDTDFSFYECDTHKTCVSCVGSRWACDWCVFENRCTHNNSTCTGSNEIIVTGTNNRGTAMEGPDACPQVQNQMGEELVPNDISRAINVNVSNLPDASSVSSYECSLDIEESSQSVDATRDGSTVTCNAIQYTYEAAEQELNVTLTLKWTDTMPNRTVHTLDDRYGFTVTLYKCEVLRPDCSRCLSEETTGAELGCVWCGDTCGVNDSVVCLMTNEIVTLDNMLNCPDPVIQGIWPLFGPIEGNTTLTLTGTDLGQQFSDLLSVTVGGQTCDLDGMDDYYSTGSSVGCITRMNMDLTPQSLLVRIKGANGTEQQSQGDQTFGYTNPVINGFLPTIGPQSGGTVLTISGEYLNSGRNIDVYISNMECRSERDEISDRSITCLTSGADMLGSWKVSVTFDGAVRLSDMNYTYDLDPTVNDVYPSKSVIAGGRRLKVNGTGFLIIQQPQIVVTLGDSLSEFMANCSASTDTLMMCTSPKINLPNLLEDSSVNISTGFIMDGVTALRNWCTDQDTCTPLEYFQNPEYYPFDGSLQKESETMIINGRSLDLAISNEEVTVYVGPDLCTNISVDKQALSCTLPENEPKAGDYLGMNTTKQLPVVWVIHGTTLTFNIGYIRYRGFDPTILIACLASACGLLIAVILAVVLYRLSKKAQKEVEQCIDEIDMVQQNLADDMRAGFAELQTAVTDLTSDLEGVGMPFVSQRDYATNMLFISLETKPMTTDPENPEEHVERAMKKFSDALSNKTFLLTLIQTLDAQSKAKLPVRDKGAIASLLTVIMVSEGKLGYLTDVLFSMMSKLVQDGLDAERPKQLFRRTETILEKLLSNWIALCLYDSLKDYTAYSLFLLYRAIKCHSEHGPMDIISGQAKYTLSDDKLLTEDQDERELTLTVIVNDADGETKEVKVLDVDAISQVKEKILDAIYRNQPYSQRPNSSEVNLEWRQGQSGCVVLRDVDNSVPTLDGWKRINTLKHYHVANKSTVALVPIAKQSQSSSKASPAAAAENVYANLGYVGNQQPSTFTGNKRSNRHTMVEADPEDGAKIWHLVKVEDGDIDDTTRRRKNRAHRHRMSIMPSRPKKRIREIYIPRLIGTKGTIQEYIDHMFEAILNAGNAPIAVKYLFDFFDSQAIRHNLEDSDAIKIWKGNSLSLRFWSSAIRRPDFIFDIRPSRAVESSLGVIAQAFHDAHYASDEKLGKDSDLSKLLFKKDLTQIEARVQNYYDGITRKPRVSIQELNKEMETTCENFTGFFSKLSTLLQLWDYVKKFNQKIVEALEDDEDCQKEHLAYKLVEVETILANQDCDEDDTV